MRSPEDKADLARVVLSFVAGIPRGTRESHGAASGRAAMILVPVKNSSSAPNSVWLPSSISHPAPNWRRPCCTTCSNVAYLEGAPASCDRNERSVRTGTRRATIDSRSFPTPHNPGETGAIEMATRICGRTRRREHAGNPCRYPTHPGVGTARNSESRARLKAAYSSRRLTDAAPTPSCAAPRIVSHSASATTASEPHHAAAQATGKPCVVSALRWHRESTSTILKTFSDWPSLPAKPAPSAWSGNGNWPNFPQPRMSKALARVQETAPKGRKNAAPGASRGWPQGDDRAPQGRKKTLLPAAPNSGSSLFPLHPR